MEEEGIRVFALEFFPEIYESRVYIPVINSILRYDISRRGNTEISQMPINRDVTYENTNNPGIDYEGPL